MADRLNGKVAIVTGAAHGIGRAIAERFGAEGATVVVCDVDAGGGEAVAKRITDAGGTAVAIVTDVSDKAAVDRLFDETLERFGAVDVLVNNAGLTNTERHFLDGDEEWWDRIHAVNAGTLQAWSPSNADGIDDLLALDAHARALARAQLQRWQD